MNRLSALPLPLPVCIADGNDAPHRRHHIGSFDLSPVAVGRFNALLGELGHATPVDRDRLVTAARSLCRSESPADIPVCIRQRLWRVSAAVSMAADRGWQAPGCVVETVRRVSAYVASNDDLIPDDVPTVGRLDDALAVDAAWPVIDAEVRGYLDFRRLRRLCARDRRQWILFDRERWLRAREDEHAFRAQRRAVREHSYLPSPARLFRVA